jgi:hypothetical protein
VKLIIEAAIGGKMPDLIKKKIDHRLYCHHYHFTTMLDMVANKEGGIVHQ